MYELQHAGGLPYPETDKYYFDKWYTTTGLTDGSEYKTVRFNIREDNLLLHWTNSYLVLEGKLVKKLDGALYGNDDLITLTHNAVPHLFSNVKLTIGNKTVENVNEVGHVSSMMFDVLHPRSKGKCGGLQYAWLPDTTADAAVTNKGFEARRQFLVTTPATNGNFKLRIPLYMFFGFMENFIVLKGYPIELQFVRGSDYPAIFRAAAAAEGKLTISKIYLDIPVVEPNTAVALQYIKLLKDPTPFLYSFRERHGMTAPVSTGTRDFQQPITSTYFTERPQMIWVGFQISNVINQTVNYALYKNSDVESMYIQMNSSQFPPVVRKANWGENDNGFFYEMQQHVRANYLQYPDRYAEGNMLTPANFKDLYTIYCFDLSKQEMALGSNNVTCDLHVQFRTATLANLRVYIAWFSDRSLEMFTDGSPINIRKQVDNYEDE